MDNSFYINKFQGLADQLDKKILAEKQVEVAVGVYHDSVFLKLYKTSWASPFQDPLTAESRIFFSVWINDAAIKEQKILYNIHALKLRQLKGYSIESRKFANLFRAKFRKFEHKWQNVDVALGPLTLLQGWLKGKVENCHNEMLVLARNFLEIAPLIDKTLATFK